MTLKKQENLVYLGIWVIAFLAPLTRFFSNSSTTAIVPSRIWMAVLHTWYIMLPFLALFLLHNFLIAPFLTDKNKRAVYAGLTVALLLLFALHLYFTQVRWEPWRHSGFRTEMPGNPARHPEMRDGRGPGMPDNPAGLKPDGRMNPDSIPEGMRQDPHGFRPGPGPREGASPKVMPGQPKFGRFPIKPLTPGIMLMVLAVFVIGINIAIKLLFKSVQREREMRDLEQQNLSSQLQYLRYQISPHFFMNTLNNIHALVDIDPEMAKTSILQLSKLMRYMLYEGDKPTIPLSVEVNFLNQYISLMKLRYNDSVKISFNVPEEIPVQEIPPLLFITFVENAFKHGISYKDESFIDIDMKFEGDRVLFRCINSKHEEQEKTKDSGIGMENTRRRLNLLYGNDCKMEIQDEGNTYKVSVDIPSKPTTKTIEQ